MLDEFYEFVRRHGSVLWVHWNMRDANYGFPALAHRCKVLGGSPVEVHDSQLIDLARILGAMYGEKYIGHPRLETLVDKNGLTKVGFLNGAEEAQAFDSREYVKLHQSTLRKVHIFESILVRIENRTLKTDASFLEKYGGYLGALVGFSSEHPVGALLTLAGTIASIGGFLALSD